MITKDKISTIGKTQKTHGIGGELNIALNAKLDENVRFLIFDIDNIFVPFRIEQLRAKNAGGFVKLEGVDSENDAKMLMGKDIFVEKQFCDEDDEIFDYSYFVGFSVSDADGNQLGQIDDVDDQTENVLIHIAERDIVLPFQADLILSVDRKKRAIVMEIPEGLLEI